MKKYLVKLQRIEYQSAEVEVEAENDLEAADIALDLEDINWSVVDTEEDVIDAEEISDED